FFQSDDPTLGVEFGDAIRLRVVSVVPEDGGTLVTRSGGSHVVGEAVTEEDVVAEHQGAGLAIEEGFADEEGLGKAFGLGLFGVAELDAPLRAVAEQVLKGGGVFWGGAHQHLPDLRQHQHAERVIDHGFVVDRDELLAHRFGDGKQPRARSARQNDALALHEGELPRFVGDRNGAVRSSHQNTTGGPGLHFLLRSSSAWSSATRASSSRARRASSSARLASSSARLASSSARLASSSARLASSSARLACASASCSAD